MTTAPPTTLAPTTCPSATYATNFGGASELDDWTEVWRTANTSLSIVNSEADQKVGDKALRYDGSSTNRKFISYDPAGSSEDQEILVLVNLGDIYGSSQGLRLYLRSSGSEGSENTYFVNFYYITPGLKISKYVNGAASDIVTDGNFRFYSNDRLVWIRFRVEGTSLKLKMWDVSSFEPVEWGLEGVDSSLSSGSLGIGSYVTSTVDIEYFACGVCGGSPSVPALTEGEIVGYIPKVAANSSSNVDYVRILPFIIGSDADGKYIHSIGMYHLDAPQEYAVRYALYKGSDETDPTDAVLVEDLGSPSITDNAWNYIYLSSPVIVSEGDVFYIGIKGDGFGYVGYVDSPILGNFQRADGSGRWDISAGEDSDDTVAWSASLAGDTMSQDDFWYKAKLLIRDDATTLVPTTVPPTYATTAAPTTTVSTTSAPTTLASTTVAPTTLAPTTLAPTTLAPTTLAPTTLSPTTLVPTTLAPTTLAPTTEVPTTVGYTTFYPSTSPPTTKEPTTLAPTTLAPTTLEPTTEAPTTSASTTLEPTTESPTTLVPTTLAPTTVAPTTVYPSTVPPTTVHVASTPSPTTLAPTTLAPTTLAETTVAPSTVSPTTEVPTTPASTTEAPTTPVPTTLAPTTLPSSTGAPTTVAVTTVVPTTAVATTLAPTTVPATTLTTAVPTTPPPVVCTHTEYSLIVDEDTIDSIIVDTDTLISLITDTDELESVIC
jgi:hypothetical protein